jgi:hypothetical protein
MSSVDHSLPKYYWESGESAPNIIFGKEWSTEVMAAAVAKIAALEASVRKKDATLGNVPT